jgi:hypothetical protein
MAWLAAGSNFPLAFYWAIVNTTWRAASLNLDFIKFAESTPILIYQRPILRHSEIIRPN